SSFTPFLTENIYQGLRPFLSPQEESDKNDYRSLHFLSFPTVREDYIDEVILRRFSALQSVTELVRTLRERNLLPLRVPLKELVVFHSNQESLDDVQTLSSRAREYRSSYKWIRCHSGVQRRLHSSKSPAVKISDPSVLSTQSSVNTKLEEANLSKTSLADSTLPKTSNETIRTASASSTLRSSTFATGALAKKRTIAQVVDTEETARPATRSRIETEENRRLESSAVEMSSTPTDPTTLNHGPGHCSSQNTMSNSPAEDDLDSLARNLLIAEVHKKQGVAPARVAWVQRIFEDNRTLAPVLARALCISLEHLDQILKQPLTQDQRSLAHQLNILCAGCARVPAQVLCTGCQVIYKRYDLFHFRDPDEGGIGGGGGRFQRV
ncbi:hypothetical protein CF326_g8898, partial [Tilletia indica]